MYVCIYIDIYIYILVYSVCMELGSPQNLTIHIVGILCEVLRLQFPINCMRVYVCSRVELDYGLLGRNM